MVTIRDVVRKCGYSVCTVSRTLSGRGYLKEGAKQKTLETVAELGYRPNTLAINLKTGRRQVLVLVLPSLTNIYYIKLEQYLESCALKKGYIIHLNNTEYSLEKEKQMLENLIGMDTVGVITTPVTSRHDHIMNLVKYDIPHVYLNRSFEDDMEHCLRLDNKRAAYEVVSYMIKLGHKNIGGIFQSFDDLTYQERYDDMTRALWEHGPDCRPGHMPFDVNPEDMGTTPDWILQLLQKTGCPGVIFAYNDMTAFNIYRACYILGLRTSNYLSAFGYDDYTMTNYVMPPLSTVSVLARKLAGTATDFTHGYLEPGVWAELPILEASLIIHNSVRDLNLDQGASISFPGYTITG